MQTRSSGEIVVDPMCGCGTIPEVASESFPGALYIGGDVADIAVEKTKFILLMQHGLIASLSNGTAENYRLPITPLMLLSLICHLANEWVI